MKKVLGLLTALLLASPVMADVEIKNSRGDYLLTEFVVLNDKEFGEKVYLCWVWVRSGSNIETARCDQAKVRPYNF